MSVIKKRGFALLKKADLKKISTQGGRLAQASLFVHKLTKVEQSRGGKVSRGNFKHQSQSTTKRIGQKGGRS